MKTMTRCAAWYLSAVVMAGAGWGGATSVLAAPVTAHAKEAGAHQGQGIAWHTGDVASAFAEAKKTNKPVFLYWGAVWCPPCNQVKATIFNRQAFIRLTRRFIPVYLDGDTPDGQRLGEQYKVRGYPTMILFRPDGNEITRLPGEVDYERYVAILERGMAATRPVKQTLVAALAGQPLSHDEWSLLADYSWETDRTQLVPEDQLVDTLVRLAKAIPDKEGETATRLRLRALAIASNAEKRLEVDRTAAESVLTRVFASPASVRAQFDVIVNYTDSLAKWLYPEGKNMPAKLGGHWAQGLSALADDASLSMNERLAARLAEIQFAKARQPGSPLPVPMIKAARDMVKQADRATTDRHERQSVIYTAAQLLEEAGRLDDSDALMRAELKRSPAPYYFMMALGSHAKRRGDAKGALEWYEKAFETAEGSATRLQWGASYLGALTELAAQDEARIEQTGRRLAAEIGKTPNAFYERNRRAVERTVQTLVKWNGDNRHRAVLSRLAPVFAGICAALPQSEPQRNLCEVAIKPLL